MEGRVKDSAEMVREIGAMGIGEVLAITVESDRVHVRLDALANKAEALRIAEYIRPFYPDRGISVHGGTGQANALVFV